MIKSSYLSECAMLLKRVRHVTQASAPYKSSMHLILSMPHVILLMHASFNTISYSVNN